MLTYDRVRVAKEYIEKKYRLKKEEEQEKKKVKKFLIFDCNIKFYYIDWEEIMARMSRLNLG